MKLIYSLTLQPDGTTNVSSREETPAEETHRLALEAEWAARDARHKQHMLDVVDGKEGDELYCEKCGGFVCWAYANDLEGSFFLCQRCRPEYPPLPQATPYWLNVYPGPNSWTAALYPSQELAEAARLKGCLECVRVELKKGEA